MSRALRCAWQDLQESQIFDLLQSQRPLQLVFFRPEVQPQKA